MAVCTTPFAGPIYCRYVLSRLPGSDHRKAQCGFVRGPTDRIVGVHSLLDDVPLKQADFPANCDDIEDKEHYRQRRFVYAPPAPPERPQRSQLQVRPRQLSQPDGAAPETYDLDPDSRR